MLSANLSNNLPHLAGCEIIIVNDYPAKSISAELKKFGEMIRVVENKKHLGFGPTVNAGIENATGSHIFLLNSDVVLKDNLFKKSLDLFNEDRKVFAVSFAQTDDKDNFSGKNVFYWNRGMFLHKKINNSTAGFNGWAEGGSCMIDRSKFIELDGFDSLYSPFYWEDIDLSYRAWKRGYTVLFDPQVTVVHIHESTIGRYFGKTYIRTIAYRNQFIFTWKNITGMKLLFSHAFFLPFFFLSAVLRRDTAFISRFFRALGLLNRIVLKRNKIREQNRKTDEQILQRLNP